jgi:hypothetical protein
MHFNLAIGTVLSAAFMWTTYGAVLETNVNITSLSEKIGAGSLAVQTYVSCEAGLSDTNICESYYCACAGDTIFCLSGTTCLSTCICAA